MSYLTLWHLACLHRADEYTGLIEDVTNLPAEWGNIPARPVPGTFYNIVKRIAYPTAQFRYPNQGVTPSASSLREEVKELFYIDLVLQVDEAIWDADPGRVGSLWQMEVRGAIEAASILVGQQTWYGTSADSSGFGGLRSQLAYIYKGTGAGTTNTTSAYLVRTLEKEGVRYDVGQNGNFAVRQPMRQQVPDPNNTGKFITVYGGNLKAWIGLNLMSDLSAWSVAGINDTSTTFTDEVGSRLLAQIPNRRRTGLVWFMNRTAHNILQISRTAINPGITTYMPQYALQPADADGRPAFSPLPNTCQGYPIHVTDSILNTESN